MLIKSTNTGLLLYSFGYLDLAEITFQNFYDMYFPETIALQRERQYYRQQFDHAHFKKESTRQQVDAVLAELERYLDEVTGVEKGMI